MNYNLAAHNFLCQVISPFTEAEDIARLKNQINRSEVSWERVIHLANTHLIISALWVGLCEKKLDSELENDVRDYLQELHTLNLKRNRGLKRQAIEAIEVLNKIGIVPLLIKGAAQLFQPIHKDFGARMMADIDVLVPGNRIPEAITALNKTGYQSYKYPNVGLIPPHHVAPLMRKGEYGSIELHYEVLGNKVALRALPTTKIWSTSEEYISNGIRFKTPNVTDAVMLGALHSQITHEYHRRLMIDYKALYDMVIMVSRQGGDVDWQKIQNRFAKPGLISVLRTHLWMAHRMFNLPVQNSMQPTVYNRIYHGLYLAKIRWAFFDHLYDRVFVFIKVRIMKRFGLLKIWPFEARSAVPDWGNPV